MTAESGALWWCRCHRVVPQVFEIRYAVGMVDVGPVILCGVCVENLREAERDHMAGHVDAQPVWAIEVVRTFGTTPTPPPSTPTTPPRAAATGPRAARASGRGAIAI